MTLTKASALFYLSTRYGVLPSIGGRPTFSRNSAGAALDASGQGYSAIINTPRFTWEADRSTTANERRAMLLLELARSNNNAFSTDFSNAAWTKTNCSITTGIDDPYGGTQACRMTATAANALLQQQLANASSLIRTNALWVRRRVGSGSFGFYDPAQAVFQTPALTDQWQRFQNTGAASIARWNDIRLAVSGDVVDLYNEQQEDGPAATGDIVNAGAGGGSRAVDSLTYLHSSLPQAMMVHGRLNDHGTRSNAGAGYWCFGDTAFNGPRFLCFCPAVGTTRLLYQAVNGGTTFTADLASAALNDTTDLVAILTPTGQIRLIQSLNGGAVTDTGLVAGAAIPAAWSDTRIQLNQHGSSAVGITAFAEFKAVKYADVVASTAQGIMDELRAFELGPNGDVL